jgi:protein arginine kinase
MEPLKNDSLVLQLNKPWSNNPNIIWLASTVELQRNIEKFKYPGKLELDRKQQIISLTGKDLLNLGSMRQATLLKAEDLSSLEKEYLSEHFLSNTSYHSATNGEAFVIDKDGEVMTLFNINNHLAFLGIDTKDDLEGTWNRLVKIETSLGKVVSYSFSPKFGFLTADPGNCGTALSVTLYLQLSGLIHSNKIDDMLALHVDESIGITGIQGNPSEVIGDILLLQNNYTLGVTEEHILSNLRSTAAKLIAEERSCRSNFISSKDPSIMDKVSRAFAILLHSYQIEAIEALNAISLLKLGVDLKWIEGITIEALNLLFFECRRAHLLARHQGKSSPAEIPHKRAEFIHLALKDVKLLVS